MSDFFATETCRNAFSGKDTPKISYGLRFPEACAKHVRDTFKSSRVYIIVSRSLSKSTDALERLTDELGEAVVGVRIGVSPHTPISEALEIIEDVRRIGAVDCFVTLGAGSITDCAKLVRFALANEAYNEGQIDTLWGGHSFNPTQAKNIRQPTIPMICIPTSLSGGEYQSIAGATERISKAKRTFEPGVDPDLVIQDPELCETTPPSIWLSTGIRSVDHCVETLCSLQSNDEGDSWARRGLAKLVPGLLRSKSSSEKSSASGGEAHRIQARHLCQLGVVEAMCAVSCGTPLGASHAIGHQLGPLGVGHGETSCILLPAVCKYNALHGANIARQAAVAKLLEEDAAVKRLIEAAQRSEVDLADILDLVIRDLGMPRTLKDVNIGEEHLEVLARNSLNDIWIKTNPVPITNRLQVLEILKLVAE